MSVNLSLIVATARPSYGSLIGLPETHLFDLTLKSLERQTSRDFELVIVDSCFRFRNLAEEIRGLGTWTFEVRVIPNEGSYWLDNGLWALQHAFNRGAEAAKGRRWLMFCGDACEFPRETVARVINWAKAGRQPLLLCRYKSAGEILRVTKENEEAHWNCGAPAKPPTLKELRDLNVFGKSEEVRDSRYAQSGIEEEPTGYMIHNIPWEWCYGYTTLHREDFFAVNGWDENFDGEKSLGDCELGSRLDMDDRWKPVLDINMTVFEHAHGPCDERVLFNAGKLRALRSNYDLIHVLRRRRQIVANDYRLTRSEFERTINSDYIKPYPDDAPERVFQEYWFNNPYYAKIGGA